MRSELEGQMSTLMRPVHTLIKGVVRFSNWFDHRFGWFFTNGMKQVPATGEEAVRA